MSGGRVCRERKVANDWGERDDLRGGRSLADHRRILSA
jgi:hypothetical protein